MMLCAGEDVREFLNAVSESMSSPAALVHEYRCYRFWHCEGLLIAWTGIGTGCVEPLLREYSRIGIPERVALVGTAGLVNVQDLKLGDTLPVIEAYSRSSAVNSLGISPNEAMKPAVSEAFKRSAKIASSDFYYPVAGGGDFEGVDFVDMETAQFYFLCSQIAHESNAQFEYLAFKGAANRLGQPQEQDLWGQRVLTASIAMAKSWIQV